MHSAVVLVAAWVVLSYQTPMGEVLQAGRVAAGNWGAPGIQLTVTEQGATVEYDCAHGSIDQPLTVARNGHFSWVGTHVAERGGPQVEGREDGRPARYEGEVSDDTIRITITEGQQDRGTFTLKQGATGRLRKCR